MDSFQAFQLAGNLDASTFTKRQQPILAIPTSYLGLNSGPKPGTVAAIVLGSVGGFLFFVYLIWAAVNFGGGISIFNRRRTVVEEEVIRRKSSGPGRRRTRLYEEEVVERRTSRRPASVRVRETSRGEVEGEDVSIPG